MEFLERELNFQKANLKHKPAIWEILKWGIELRRKDGSTQWQDGYPNLSTIERDLEKEVGFVLLEDEQVVGYCAVFLNEEPAYDRIQGAWLSQGDSLVVHRMGIDKLSGGKGYAKKMLKLVEKQALSRGVHSIKVDTNFDNQAMLKILKSLGYQHCGEVKLRGASRLAFEKLF